MSTREIIDIYISFFEKRGHKQITNSPLVPQNDPTTLFTSSGMQPLIQYLLGEQHPEGTRLVNVQNSFRAQDIEEVGDNRHTTFFRMLGNWSLGDYFKKEEIPWLWEFLTVELGLPKEKLYITVFKGEKEVPYDKEAYDIWSGVLRTDNQDPKTKIFTAGVNKNWWSRSGVPDNMPVGEPGGPDSEVYFRFDDLEHEKECKDNPVECECGKFLEIANAVFMQYVKTEKGFEPLPKQNVDFGGGLERLLAAVEKKSDIFETSLFAPVIESVQKNLLTKFNYREDNRVDRAFRIITDHLIAATFIINERVLPDKKDRGSVLRRLIRRAVSQKHLWGEKYNNFDLVIDDIINIYGQTDPVLKENSSSIKTVIKDEEVKANRAINEAFRVWRNWVAHNPSGGVGSFMPGEFMPGEGAKLPPLPAEKMFHLFQSYGLSLDIIEEITQGNIDKEGFNKLLKKHQDISRVGSTQKFKGGLADTSEQTIMGHTATHLLHQALRDILGNHVFQTGSNITSERIRFDFNFERNLTEEEVKNVEDIVNSKIKENLPVHFEIMPLKKAKELSAVGLFDEKYAKDVKVYFVGGYSKEFCGGPHVEFTGLLKRFKIKKVENIGKGQRRIYAFVADQI